MDKFLDVLENDNIKCLSYLISCGDTVIADGDSHLFTIDVYDGSISIEHGYNNTIFIPSDADVNDMTDEDIHYQFLKGSLVIDLWLILEE